MQYFELSIKEWEPTYKKIYQIFEKLDSLTLHGEQVLAQIFEDRQIDRREVSRIFLAEFPILAERPSSGCYVNEAYTGN